MQTHEQQTGDTPTTPKGGQPTKKDLRVNILFTPRALTALDRWCEEHDRSRNWTMSRVVEYLEDEEELRQKILKR